MSKFFVIAPSGKAFTKLVDTSGEALQIATNKRNRTPYRKRPIKGADRIWLKMKAEGYILEKCFE